MTDLPHSLLEEYKTQASILLKNLHAADAQLAAHSLRRFQKLPQFAALSETGSFKRKHALQVIALEQGYATWAEFKKFLERQEALKQRRQRYHTLLYPARCGGYMLEWHADYEVASQALGRTQGYLLPYRNQFFICEAEYIAELGLAPDDPDWERIGYNWVKPQDDAAWQRLNAKLEAAAEQA